MGFREMIRKVQLYSGFSDDESKDALEHMVEAVAVHLPEIERLDFADQLPDELRDIALSVYATDKNSRSDLVDDFVEIQHVDVVRAKKQIISAWQALKEVINERQVRRIRAQLPNSTVALLR